LFVFPYVTQPLCPLSVPSPPPLGPYLLTPWPSRLSPPTRRPAGLLSTHCSHSFPSIQDPCAPAAASAPSVLLRKSAPVPASANLLPHPTCFPVAPAEGLLGHQKPPSAFVFVPHTARCFLLSSIPPLLLLHRRLCVCVHVSMVTQRPDGYPAPTGSTLVQYWGGLTPTGFSPPALCPSAPPRRRSAPRPRARDNHSPSSPHQWLSRAWAQNLPEAVV